MGEVKNQDENGNYALWDKGKFIGYGKMEMIDGKMVLDKYRTTIQIVQQDAAKDGVLITLNSGFRQFVDQVRLRRQNVIDKAKIKDDHYLLTAPSTAFKPPTAIPGWSNHQDGTAFDFSTTGKGVYEWLVKHAIKYGLVRTVASEVWHWEIRPGVDQFAVVSKAHESWRNLV